MNKLKTIGREAVSRKILLKIQKVNPLKQFAKHYLDRGSVHASKIGWTHGKIQHKIYLKSGQILQFFFSAELRKKIIKRLWNI